MSATRFQPQRIALALHGGAGAISRGAITPRQTLRYRQVLGHALDAGWSVLARGGTSLDAVCAAVVVMEDSPLFNAGRGAVFNADGRHELDASVMDGATLAAGAVAALTVAKNPVLVARAVMERTPHVMLAGSGAGYFYTHSRWGALQRLLRGVAAISETERHGTVGAVACDANGNLAAATSTGGMTGKQAGRIGDSAVIGAGTYADNAACAVSTTGHGEAFIRAAVAHDIVARMRYRRSSLGAAVEAAIQSIARLVASGGVIAVDRGGQIAIDFNSAGMYRAYRSTGGRPVVAIY
jgi:beta-aspartyl-peptidase (threonine type)